MPPKYNLLIYLRLMNIIYAKKETPDIAVIGLHAEKAFSSTNTYLKCLTVLE